MKTIVFTSAAAKQFDALPPVAQIAVERALDRLAVDGAGDVKKLRGRDGYRLRVGEYRVLFDETLTTIFCPCRRPPANPYLLMKGNHEQSAVLDHARRRGASHPPARRIRAHNPPLLMRRRRTPPTSPPTTRLRPNGS